MIRSARLGLWAAVLLAMLAAAAGCFRRSGPVEVTREVGTVRILSEPEGAAVDFDGRPRGEAFKAEPLVIRGVPYGWHSIRATRLGMVPHILEFNLERPEAEFRIPVSAGGAGRLTVRTVPPGAEVFISSRYYGKADPQIQVSALAYGEHSLWVRLDGHRQERINILVERQIERTYHLFLTKVK
ncbi:MAG: PEGA domain-containing protein [Candidatus Tectomicrobia bacterium]|uniref:PEGA domain-containing protein n=1 Tax=Tectimicrobiota bacterium TaxID=2528274 RepID=A0A932MP58_UNCTE|nr:PEGA domain-containing protein [Candidatus Tectomicrobia bacterium]